MMSKQIFAATDKSDCAREPIHTPGAIQPHGYLLILDPADHAVMAVSSNLAEALDLSVSDMIGRPVGEFLMSTEGEAMDPLSGGPDGAPPIRVVLRHADRPALLDGVVRNGDEVMLLELEPSSSPERDSYLFGALRTAIERIRHSPSIEVACQALATEVRQLSGFDQVMVYRFDGDWNGQVVAEDRLAGMTSYLGHAFPASDIPAQARALYLLNTVRIIPDARYRPSPISPPLNPSNGRPFDLSTTTLRSVSPVHLEYLANMGVAASMSVSIIRDNRLWGLVACHHTSPRILPRSVLESCELLAQTAAWYLDAKDTAATALSLSAVRRLELDLERHDPELEPHSNVKDRLASIQASLLAATRSDGLAILEADTVWAIGGHPSARHLSALADWLTATNQDRLATDRLSRLYPPAAGFTALASGMVATRLGAGWMVWFRAEQPQSITWAGRPDQPHQRNAETGRINPRRSFKSWRQTVHGRSDPWSAADLSAVDEAQALVLRAMVSDLAAATIREISARKGAEEGLAQMEARYRGLLEAAPDAMVVVNEAGEVVLLNLQAEKQFGYRRDELIGRPVTDIIPKGFAERLIADSERTAAEALAQQIGTGMELIGHRKDGTEFPIELMLSPLESADGVLVTAAIRDGTARREVIEALEQRLILERATVELARSNSDLQQFAYIAAHDLQEPLRMVTSFSRLLANDYHGRLDASGESYIDLIVDGGQRMQRLIEDLLTYCQAGTSTKDLHETSSQDALDRALENLQTAIDESGGSVTCEPLPILIADPSQLTQLFQNLVGNSMKYRGAEPPRVHVAATRNSAHEWVFSIADNGLGIEPRHFHRIFLMFQRLHGRLEFSGTGIGLSLCKKIAERHGGRIWVESKPGAGSTFFLALPDRCAATQ